MLGALIDGEDIIDKILEELGDEYKELVRAVQARDSSITFDELYEKLLMFEASLNTSHKASLQFSPTANAAVNCSKYRSQNSFGQYTPPPSPQWSTSFRSSSRPQRQTHNQGFHHQRPGPRPYLGYCQVCRLQGHTAKRCPSFRFVPQKTVIPKSSNNSNPWQPQVHLVTSNESSTPTSNVISTPSWLLDSGSSHHITADLHNLSLHTPYTSSDDVMIGDGTGLRITHTGSSTLHLGSSFFNLKNILCVPDIKKKSYLYLSVLYNQ
jgi:hypothetical protein